MQLANHFLSPPPKKEKKKKKNTQKQKQKNATSRASGSFIKFWAET